MNFYCENILTWTTFSIFNLPCSTTFVENSNFRVKWEQLESEGEGRGFGLSVRPESDWAPPIGSIPTNGRKPTSSPNSTDAHTGSRGILSCGVRTNRWENSGRAGWDENFQVQSSETESILQTVGAAKRISFCVSAPWCSSRVVVSGAAPGGMCQPCWEMTKGSTQCDEWAAGRERCSGQRGVPAVPYLVFPIFLDLAGTEENINIIKYAFTLTYIHSAFTHVPSD